MEEYGVAVFMGFLVGFAVCMLFFANTFPAIRRETLIKCGAAYYDSVTGEFIEKN